MTPRPIAPDIGSTPYPPPPLKSTPAQAPGPDTWPSSGRAAAPSAGYISGKLIVQTTRAEILLPRGKTELIIGRSDPVRNIYPDVDLTGYGGDKSGVSRSHARLIVQGFQVYLEDLNSTNFTFLNRQKLNPGQRYLLKNGDEIRVGLLTFEYLEV
jgi:pSer/pThr/pTyr-binding forkhead associated (FHA) protein